MADVNSVIAQGAAQRGMSLPEIAGVSNLMQGMQQRGIQIESSKKILDEQNNVRKFMSDPQNMANVTNPDGTINEPAFRNTLVQLAPTQGADIASKVIGVNIQGTAAQVAKAGLTQEGQAAIGNFWSSIDPNTSVPEMMKMGEDMKKLYPNSAPMIDYQMKYGVLPYAKDPDTLKQALYRVGLASQPTPTQISSTTPTLVNTGLNMQNINPASTQQNMPLSPGPGTTTMTPTGAQVYLGQTPSGVHPVFTLPQAKQQQLSQNQAEIQNVNSAARSVGTEHSMNQNMINLFKQTSTGIGAEIGAKLGGKYAGIPWTTDNAKNFDMLNHQISLSNVEAANNAGLNGTNAARDLAGQANADIHWTPQAGIENLKLNDALVTGKDFYNRAIQANQSATNNPESLNFLRTKWGQTVDMNTLRFYNASKNGDTEEVKNIINSVGGQGSQGYQDLMAKTDRMLQLAKTGK